MAGVNKFLGIGNLGADPELSYTPSGKAVAKFSVAITSGEYTEWVRCVAWERLAEVCSEYLKKGSKVYIEGRLATRSWESDSGEKKYVTEVVLFSMQMLDSKPKQSNGPLDDDIPF